MGKSYLRNEIRINTNKNNRIGRRGRRKSEKSFVKSLRFLGVNTAGLRPKLLTFKKVIKELMPSVLKKKKKIKYIRTQED